MTRLEDRQTLPAPSPRLAPRAHVSRLPVPWPASTCAPCSAGSPAVTRPRQAGLEHRPGESAAGSMVYPDVCSP